MKVFLIILAVLVVLIAVILSVSAEFTIVFDNGWSTKVRVLFIEKDIKLSKLLSFIVFPDKVETDVAKGGSKKKDKPKTKNAPAPETAPVTEIKEEKKEPSAKAKPNYLQKILQEDGIAGIMLLVSNLIETLNSAASTLIIGLHIYSLYVKMIIGGGDAADIGEKYGAICGWYYPLKGLILNQMKVDEYDDYIQADFIAPRSEYEFQFIGSISVGLLVKMFLRAGKTFLVNSIKNK